MKSKNQPKPRRKEEIPELYDKWRTQVYRRDHFACQKCGGKQKLEAHHIRNFSSHPKLRYDVQNGITLCIPCHENFHRIFGKENNDERQIEKFIGKVLVKMNKLF